MSYGYNEDWLTPALAQYVHGCTSSMKLLSTLCYRRVCNAYMALGARGVSLIFGSGKNRYFYHVLSII